MKKKGEMVLTADISQDIYGRTKVWNQTSGGKWGPWANLKYSYRLPLDLVHLMRAFLTEYLPEMKDSLPYPKQTNFNFVPTDLRWKQVTGKNNVSDILLKSLLKQLERIEDLGISELVLLTSSNKVGLEVVNKLEKLGIKGIRSFHYDTEQRVEFEKPVT